MTVIFSNEVNNGMKNYLETLKSQGKYNVSAKRAQEKYLAMKHEIENAAQNPDAWPICTSRVLGQSYRNGKPKKVNLRKYVYDGNQTNSQWIFSFLVDKKHNEVTVFKMCHSSKVINEEHGEASIRRVTETKFRQIVREETVKLLSNLIK